MRKGLLAAVAGLFVSAALASAQSMLPPPPVPMPAPPPPDPGAGLQPYVAGTGPAPDWMHCLPAGCCNPNQPDEMKCYGGHFWVNADYLLWWLKQPKVPPLVTSSTPASAGVLGNPDTTVLFGDRHLDLDRRNGIRASMGYTCPDEILGIEGTGFYFFDNRRRFQTASDAGGSPVIARPFINAATGLETVQLVAFPGSFAGDVQVSNLTRFWGSDVNLIGVVYGGCQANFDFLGGFRYLDLNDDFRMVKNSTLLPAGQSALNGILILPPASNTVTDRFVTRSQFFGGQMGGQAEFRCGCIFLDLIGKVALGNSHEVITISGSTSVTQPGVGTTTVPGGLLALASNSGQFRQDDFAMVGEAQVNLGIQICKVFRAYVGYNFLYWSDVVRTGDQITRVISESQIPSSITFGIPAAGPTAPPLPFRQSSFWAHGLNGGFALRY